MESSKGTTHTTQELTKKKTEAESTTHMAYHQGVSSIPYTVTIKYLIEDTHNSICDYKIIALVDSRSPVGLIKESYVPLQACEPMSNNVHSYCGINGTPLTVLGKFHSKITVNNIDLNVQIFKYLNFKIFKYYCL